MENAILIPGDMAGDSVAVALATSAQLANLWAGDRLFLTELQRRGCRAAPLVWDDPASNWREWPAVVIRSCWDYHLKTEGFCRWLDHLAGSGIVVLNPPGLVRWNLHKGYLFDVARAGGLIPPTRLAARSGGPGLASHLAETGWTAAVIKPAISASGYSTHRVAGQATPDDEAVFARMLGEGDVLLQALVPEVHARGEWSFVFFEGRFSHAVLKRAAPGEFRVHIEWGGTVEGGAPPPALVRDAQALVDALRLDAVYARVDGTEVDGRLMVMELELIEPELFFDHHPDAPARMADAVLTRLRTGTAAER